MTVCKGTEDIISQECTECISVPVSDCIDCFDESAVFQKFIKQENITKGNYQCWPYRILGFALQGRLLVFGRNTAECVGLDIILKYAAFPIFKDALLFVNYPAKI